MKIEINLYASLSAYLPNDRRGNSCTMQVDDHITIDDLLAQLEVPARIPKIIFLNGVHVKGDTPLKEGDRVGVFPPVAGG